MARMVCAIQRKSAPSRRTITSTGSATHLNLPWICRGIGWVSPRLRSRIRIQINDPITNMKMAIDSIRMSR